jgi:repressor LexA
MLTRKQKEVYDYICAYLDEHGTSPTQLEIKEYFGFKSLGSVQDYIKYLVNGGYLRNDSNAVRGLVPVTHAEPSVEIPLLGKVAAGNPIEVVEGQETIPVPRTMLKQGTHFALTVTGQSMIEDGILDGDVIIIKKQQTANNGDTVVATVDHEATVKRFYKKSSKIELHPANSSMKPIIVSDQEFQIKGILVGLLRQY